MNGIKQLIKVDVPDVENKIQAIAKELGYKDLDKLTKEEQQLVADEVITRSGSLSVPNQKNELTTIEPSKKSNIVKSQSVNPNLKSVIQDSVQGTEKIYQTVDNFYGQLESDRAKQIIERARQVNPNILGSVIEELQNEAKNTDNFCIELESILRETYSGI